MKNAKKVLAMVIVLALAISMAIPAMAANSIIIDNAQTGASYSAYKMADLTKNGDAYAYSIAADSPWLALFQANADIFTLAETNNGTEYIITAKTGIANDSDEMKQFAIDAVAHAKAKSIAATATSTTITDGKVTLSGLAEGYYCVDSKQGTVCIVDTAHNDGDVEIVEKNDIPTLVKKVNNLKADDVYFGEDVTYTLTITVADGAEGYKVVDTLPANVTYKELVSVVASDSTVVSAEKSQVGQVVTFIVKDEEKVAVGQTITITYTATVTNAVLVDSANTNTATLYYGENSAFTSNTDTAKVYTWSLDLVKYANGDVADLLADAKFEIYNVNPTSNGATPLKFTFDGGVYKYDKVGTVTEVTTNATDDLTFTGLDEGTYWFVETAAPQGYNKLAGPVEVSITSDGTDSLTATYAGTAATNNNDVRIENKSGAELPSTGGTGTVIFIAVGSFLVIAMGVLLVVRKRMSKVVYTR